MNRWLEINGPYIKNSVHQERERQKQQVRDIRQWCSPITKSATSSTKTGEIQDPLNSPRRPIKSTMKTIQDYFRGKSTNSHKPSPPNTRSSPPKPRIRVSKAQKYIQTMLKITKRPQPSCTSKSDNSSSAPEQSSFTPASIPPNQPRGTEPVNDPVHKGSTIATLVKKFERWKTGGSRTQNQKTPDHKPPLENSLSHIKTATR